ncbi:MAG: AsnC family transcriptional regulator [archaeon GW2011_AR3]|nr:MAG: AsnC family transcriptional regulator [archaeon GW2011_AR3]
MMEKRDALILSHLRNDARETLTRMSRKTSIPVSTIYDRLKAQESSIIKRYTALLDFNELGYNARCKVILKIAREKKEALEKFLISHISVNSLYKINNGFDFLVEGIFKSIKESEDFLEALEIKFGVKTKQVYYIIDDIKRESFMSDPELLGILGLV